MYFLGTFATEQAAVDDIPDIGFFPFPALGTEFDGENAIDAPIDGFALGPDPKNPEAAKAFLVEKPEIAAKIRGVILEKVTVSGGTALGESAGSDSAAE